MKSIVFESVHKIFRPHRFFFWGSRRVETHALKGLSVGIASGEVLGLLGPNGSGKSTTLKLISTMLLPDQGRVIVRGCETRRHGQLVRRQVGFALASERSFFPRLTVLENLEFFAALEDVPRREIADRLTSVLREISISDAADKQVMKLSSGIYQRLGIARALIKRPSVLLLDEPTRSLDTAAASELWKLIRELSSVGITIVLATHNFEEAAAVCDRAALLQRGELLAVRPVGNSDPVQLRDFYLEITRESSPQTFRVGVPA
jgi:ABC-type multidrug transport system ATPase subunit